MAVSRKAQRFMVLYPDGEERYGRRDPNTGRWKKAGVPIDYIAKKLDNAANLCSAALYSEIVKMSQSFFDAYKNGELPKLTGNLIDSTVIHIARGEKERESVHVTSAIAVRDQHWGNWGYIQKGHGRGENYRMEDIRDDITYIGESDISADVAVVLSVGIPYAGPMNLYGAKGHNRNFFDDMAEDFREDLRDISEEVAEAMDYRNRSMGAVSFRGVGRDIRNRK